MEPSSRVEWLHERPRYSFSFGSAPSEFPSSVTDQTALQEWGEGVGMWTLIFAVIGVVLLVVILVGYFASCCCLSREKRDRQEFDENTQNPKGYNKRYYVITLLLSLVFLVFAASTFAPITSFDDGYNRGLDGVEQAQGKFKDVTSAMTEISDKLAISASVSAEIDIEAGQNNNDEVETAMEKFGNSVNATIKIAKNSDDLAASVAKDLDTLVSDGRDVSDTYARTVSFAYAGAMCATMVIFVVTLVPMRICSCTYKGIGVPINMLFFLILWIFTGVILSTGIAFADFCVEPVSNSLNIFESAAGSSGDAVDSIRFYLTCNPSDKDYEPQPDDGLRFKIFDTLNSTRDLLNNGYEEALDTVEEHGTDAMIEDFSGLRNDSLNPALDELEQLDDDFRCGNVQPIFFIFVEALCEDVISDGVVVLFALQTIMGALLFFILAFGWSFCIRHPSRDRVTDKNRIAAAG
eukprot:gb/GECG01001240.1/.p1 GENE.gb/GECG01001240.1/~~gb/GECG01001240.1/.p1  ORF type:complete len:464 (+),score=42.93 gb/GECG01001240.1/:1-1392(+)